MTAECIARRPVPELFVVIVRTAQRKIKVGQERDGDQRGDQAKRCHEARRLFGNNDDASPAAFGAEHGDRAEVWPEVQDIQTVRSAAWTLCLLRWSG